MAYGDELITPAKNGAHDASERPYRSRAEQGEHAAPAVTFKPEDFAKRCRDCPTSTIDSKP
jgi:hypothetical protein